MMYNIKHITEYVYSDEVSHCYNMGHLIPRNTSRQKCLNAKVAVEPGTAFSSKRLDYFGNTAFHFEIQSRHKKLIITADSLVDSNPQNANIELELGISCEEALERVKNSKHGSDLTAKEFLFESPMIKFSEELKSYAQPSFESNRPFLSGVLELTQRIFEDFTYCPESTTIATPLEDVLKNKKGVCQDFAHLQIACLRSLGFPAKYVSGYIETLPPPGQEKLAGSDASHAWLSVYSPGEGWFEFDPTNNCLAAEQHIITAWGRDYYDVTPLKGVIFGGGESPLLNISVDVSRVT